VKFIHTHSWLNNHSFHKLKISNEVGSNQMKEKRREHNF